MEFFHGALLCTVRRCIIMWRWNVLKAYLLYSLSTFRRDLIYLLNGVLQKFWGGKIEPIGKIGI